MEREEPGSASASTSAGGGWAGRDLREVVEIGLERGGGLLTAGEVVVARRILALPAEALELYARLSARVGPVFRVARLTYSLDVAAAVDDLVAAGLVHTQVSAERSIPAFDLPYLRAACARLGLSGRGRRADVEARLIGCVWVDKPADERVDKPADKPVDERVVLPGHRQLLSRLELLCFERPWMDRQTLVLERLGAMCWADHPVTGGAPLFRRRAALRAWERARAGEWADEGESLRIAAAGPAVERGRLDAWRYAVEAVLAGPCPAETLLMLDRAGASVAPQLALALEREGRADEALAICRRGGRSRAASPGDTARGDAATNASATSHAPTGAATSPDPIQALALDRTGARIARKLRRSWPPQLLRDAPQRTLRLPRVVAAGPSGSGGAGGARASWRVGDQALPVEAAVIAVLAQAGREAVWSENHLWTSLFALCFADLYFLPIPGVLPTPRRDGPVDVGTPAFALHREKEVFDRVREIREGAAEKLVSTWRGERLAGLSAPDLARSLAGRLPGPLLAIVLHHLAHEGWSVASGLPDLCVLPGPPTRVEGVLPARLDGNTILVEVKGEGDSLRDAQRLWHQRMLENGISVECWWVRDVS